jgi:phage anti-repressor protein/predicted GIY-YIG superfamily endonuclease
MYNPDTVQTDLVIDADKAVEWLGVRKYNLLKLLRSQYKLGIDFQVEKISHPTGMRYGGNTYKRVSMTPDCFKRVCMLSRTPRAEEVRTYFIGLESLLVKYRQQLVQGMAADIRLLQRAAKPKDPADSAGYIYVIRASAENDSVYKIGRTQDLNRRIATYTDTGRADGVEVVFKFRTESHKATEACVKAMLRERQYRKYKEVYQADIDMIKDIIRKCDDVASYTRIYTSRKPSKMTGGYYIVLERE